MEKSKKGLIKKTLDRCRSVGRKPASAAAEGCLTVYVGEGRQRFVVRTECVNHPLFRALLEEAEQAFGHAGDGPLALPCDAYAFVRVLEQIEQGDRAAAATPSCGLLRSRSASRMLSPARPLLSRQLSAVPAVRAGFGYWSPGPATPTANRWLVLDRRGF